MGSIEEDFITELAIEACPESDLKAYLECICPKCGKVHTMQLHWTGNFTPRKYCKICRSHLA
jgi:hypothetical protein